MKNKLLLLLGASAICLLPEAAKAQNFPNFELNTDFMSTDVCADGLWNTNFYHGNCLWVDINNDGKLDLLAMGHSTGKTDVLNATAYAWKNMGNGQFQLFENVPLATWTNPVTSEPEGAQMGMMAAIDYNNDGNLDFIVMGLRAGNDEGASTSVVPSKVFINLLKGKGDGTFEIVSNTGLMPLFTDKEEMYNNQIVTVDYNRDGYQDVSITGRICNEDGSNSVRHIDIYKNNQGDGTFTLLVDPNVAGGQVDSISSGSMAWGDYDKDGYPDLLVNGYKDGQGKVVSLVHNEGNDKFTTMDMRTDKDGVAGVKGCQSGMVGWADLNNDGWLDAFISGRNANNKASDYYMFLLKNKGNDQVVAGTPLSQFELVPTNTQGVSRNQTEFIDLNADGILDMAAAAESYVGTSAQKSHFRLSMGKGDFQFDEAYNYVTYPEAANTKINQFMFRAGASFQMADYDEDGYMDAVGMGYANGTSILMRVIHNLGTYRTAGNVAESIEMKKNIAPDAPTSVSYSGENGKTVITWEDGYDAETKAITLRYNVCVEKKNGEIYMLVPADLATGKLKVADCNQAILGNKFVLNIPVDQVNKCYVQTVDQGKLTSEFATAVATGVASAKADQLNLYVANQILTINSQDAVSIDIYDMAGQLILSQEVVNGKMNLPALKGVYLIKAHSLKGNACKKVCL